MYDQERTEDSVKLRIGVIGGNQAAPAEQPITNKLADLDKSLSLLSEALYALEQRLMPVIAEVSETAAIDKSTTTTGNSMVAETLDKYDHSVCYMRDRVEVLLNSLEI